MNRLSLTKQALVLSHLTEGNSIRSTERITGIHRDTIIRLLIKSGSQADQCLNTTMRNLYCKYLQVDEIWTYVRKKQRQLTESERVNGSEFGDNYVFVAIDAETKLVPLYMVGKRDGRTTVSFLYELNRRLRDWRFQLTTDAYHAYLDAVYLSFNQVDYAQIIKSFAEKPRPERRYSPGRLLLITKKSQIGKPDHDKISTSYIERQNLTMRMQMRRFTRLTNGFSKKLDNLKAACALHFFQYNFMRIHRTLRCTPAMAAKLTNHIWTWEELLS